MKEKTIKLMFSPSPVSKFISIDDQIRFFKHLLQSSRYMRYLLNTRVLKS